MPVTLSQLGITPVKVPCNYEVDPETAVSKVVRGWQDGGHNLTLFGAHNMCIDVKDDDDWEWSAESESIEASEVKQFDAMGFPVEEGDYQWKAERQNWVDNYGAQLGNTFENMGGRSGNIWSTEQVAAMQHYADLMQEEMRTLRQSLQAEVDRQIIGGPRYVTYPVHVRRRPAITTGIIHHDVSMQQRVPDFLVDEGNTRFWQGVEAPVAPRLIEPMWREPTEAEFWATTLGLNPRLVQIELDRRNNDTPPPLTIASEIPGRVRPINPEGERNDRLPSRRQSSEQSRRGS